MQTATLESVSVATSCTASSGGPRRARRGAEGVRGWRQRQAARQAARQAVRQAARQLARQAVRQASSVAVSYDRKSTSGHIGKLGPGGDGPLSPLLS